MRSIYSEPPMDTIRVLYRVEDDIWSAESPDIENWLAVANSFEECRRLAEEGVRFALEREDLVVEHYVPAPV